MQLRTFMAGAMSEALSQIRRDMGPEAVILSSETLPDGRVMVRAALDETSAYDDMDFSDDAPERAPEMPAFAAREAEVLAQLQAVCAAASGVVDKSRARAAQPHAKPAPQTVEMQPVQMRRSVRIPALAESLGDAPRPADALRPAGLRIARAGRASAPVSAETGSQPVMRGGVGLLARNARPGRADALAARTQSDPVADPRSAPAQKSAKVRQAPRAQTASVHLSQGALLAQRAQLLAVFAHHRLPDGLAHALAERAAESGIADITQALAAALDERMHAAPIDFTAATGLLLTGPGGAGKTATAAKMAAHAQLAGREVCFIATDTQGAGAVARLAAFAKHLQAECIAAETTAMAQRAIRAAQQSGALAIVDTAGCDPRREVSGLGPAIRGVEIIGIVSAMTDSEEMGEIAEAMRPYDISRLVVTQADMTRRLGAVVTAALAKGMGLAHVTRSPFVADGLEQLSPEILARQLMISKEESVQ